MVGSSKTSPNQLQTPLLHLPALAAARPLTGGLQPLNGHGLPALSLPRRTAEGPGTANASCPFPTQPTRAPIPGHEINFHGAGSHGATGRGALTIQTISQETTREKENELQGASSGGGGWVK